jgi:hypothetical protein
MASHSASFTQFVGAGATNHKLRLDDSVATARARSLLHPHACGSSALFARRGGLLRRLRLLAASRAFTRRHREALLVTPALCASAQVPGITADAADKLAAMPGRAIRTVGDAAGSLMLLNLGAN